MQRYGQGQVVPLVRDDAPCKLEFGVHLKPGAGKIELLTSFQNGVVVFLCGTNSALVIPVRLAR